MYMNESLDGQVQVYLWLWHLWLVELKLSFEYIYIKCSNNNNKTVSTRGIIRSCRNVKFMLSLCDIYICFSWLRFASLRDASILLRLSNHRTWRLKICTEREYLTYFTEFFSCLAKSHSLYCQHSNFGNV